MTIFKPLEQFEVVPMFGTIILGIFNGVSNYDISLVIVLGLIVFLTYTYFGSEFLFSANMVKGILISLINFVQMTIEMQLSKFGELFFGIISTVFLFILASNLISLVPGHFCVTSHLIVTFCLSFSVFFGSTIYFIWLRGYNFLLFFVPKNVPKILIILLIPIEIISYISRVISLAVRLFANMVAGHSLLNILSSAVVVGNKKVRYFEWLLLVFLLIPLTVIILIFLLEFGIAFLQSYVFIVLFSIYIRDIFAAH